MFCRICNTPGHAAGACPDRKPAAPKARARGPWAVRFPGGDWANWDDQIQAADAVTADTPPAGFVFKRRADAQQVARFVGRGAVVVPAPGR